MNTVLVNLDGRQVNVVIESGGLGAASSVAVAEAEAAAATAVAAAIAAAAELSTAALKANNLSDLTSAPTALTNLGGTTVGKDVFTAADAAAARTAIGTVIGTDVQAYAPNLTTWAGVTPGTGVATALTVNVGSAGAFTTLNGVGGTPSSLTLTNATGLPVDSGISGLGTGVATALAINTGSTGAFLTSTEVAASGGSALVGWLSSAIGAIARTVYDRLNDVVSVKDFGATGDGTTDDSSALNLALASGKSLRFPAGTYKAALLTSSAARQTLYADGEVVVEKNGNGALLTHSGTRPTIRGIAFKGDGFTGDGLVLSGDSATLINCGSQNMAGRAVKATGNRFTLWGTNPLAVYNTTDATGTGYDLEVGVSGTATLYHHIDDFYSSQSTGGILLTDTGSHTIIGGEYGKLTIAAGTSPSGVNGGKTVASRILGNVTANVAGAKFAACDFSSIVITFGASTSGCSLDRSNTIAVGGSVVNNGNTNNHIELEGGVSALMSIKYGHSASLAVVSYDPASGDQFINAGHTRYVSGKGTIYNDNANIIMSGSNLGITNNVGAIQYGSTSQHQFIVGGVVYGTINTTGFLLPSGAALYNNSIKVVGAQGAAVADATDAASAITQLNALLARVRDHGLIAT